MVWLDIESGRPFKLEMRCDEAFRDGLESVGFLRVARTGLEPNWTEHSTMNTDHDPGTVAQNYAEAYARYCSKREERAAAPAHDQPTTLHTDSPEAGYTPSQVDGSAKHMVVATGTPATELSPTVRSLRPGADSPAAVSP